MEGKPLSDFRMKFMVSTINSKSACSVGITNISPKKKQRIHRKEKVNSISILYFFSGGKGRKIS
jgi:hypothetical protein